MAWLRTKKSPKATGDGAAGAVRDTLPCQSPVSKRPSTLLGLWGPGKLEKSFSERLLAATNVSLVYFTKYAGQVSV